MSNRTTQNETDNSLNMNLSELQFLGKESGGIRSFLHPNHTGKIAASLNLLKIFAQQNHKEHVQVVIPSLTIGREHLKDIVGILHYETRCLWEVLKTKNPFSKIVYVSAVKMDPAQLDHIFSLIPDGENARSRVKFIHLDDSSIENCLTDKLLLNEETIQKIQSELIDEMSYMSAFLITDREHKLASKIGVPLFGHRPDLDYIQTKSGNRKVFAKAGVVYSDGINDLHSTADLISAVKELWSRHQNIQRIMVKLDYGVSGKGNALLKLPMSYSKFIANSEEEQNIIITSCFTVMKFQGTNWKRFENQLSEGAIVECFIEGEQKSSPSCQAVINPNGEVEILSTHEQVLDESGMVFLGAKFPANRFHRKTLQTQTIALGREMAKRGVIGCFSVDFLVSMGDMGRQTHVIEINLRQGGTTHPYQMAKLVTDSTFDEKSGNLVNQNGVSVYYRSNDNVLLEGLKNKNSKDLLAYLEEAGVLFDPHTGKGAVFHLLSAMSDFGKLGYTAIGKDRRAVIRLHERILKLLEEFSEL